MRPERERPYRVMEGKTHSYVYMGYDLERAILAFQMLTFPRGALMQGSRNDHGERIIHALDINGNVIGSIYGVTIGDVRQRLH